MIPPFVHETLRYLETAQEIYDSLNLPDELYLRHAPAPWVAFMIGGILSAIGNVYWMVRVHQIYKVLGDTPRTWSLRLRAWISAFIDNDSPTFTIVKMGAQSFLFLGGLQLDYHLTFSVMLIYFFLESTCDSLRILLALFESKSLDDIPVTSPHLEASVRKREVTELVPSNVYEDLSRTKLVVLMVFITQAILIAFVVLDIWNSSTHTCPDPEETEGCPVVGTLFSWCFYVLGIFMACVFLLGPNSNFGHSAQNPGFWLQLLFASRKSNTTCTWYDPLYDKTYTKSLRARDWRIWMRFTMSFLINGTGFYILVHALPIQVSAQNSFLGVVLRALGMIYLVNLDDSPGYPLTIVSGDDTDHEEQVDPEMQQGETAEQPRTDEGAVSAQAERIIAEARAQLDALAAGQVVATTTSKKANKRASAMLALAGAAPMYTDGASAREMSTPDPELAGATMDTCEEGAED